MHLSAWSIVSKGNEVSSDSELLTGLSVGELEALAEGMLAPAIQERLNELIAQSKERRLASSEQVELDRLLTRADQLTLVKTRARYTLRQQRAGVAGS